MNLANRTVWQQAAGDKNRDYASLCVRWGVILNGPGHIGRWPDCEPALSREGRVSRKVADLRRFCEQMRAGDIVVLRLGTDLVMAVGVIVGDYEHREQFGDVDGWYLQHVRRVRWLDNFIGQPHKFDAYTLKQGDTTQKVTGDAVRAWLASLEIRDEAIDLPALPADDAAAAGAIDIGRISDFLFDRGMSSMAISQLVAEIGELVRIAGWYARQADHSDDAADDDAGAQDRRPSEHETVAYLVVPLLRALGWTPQRMAIEWNRVDVALFRGVPRAADNVDVVVEAKKMDRACLVAVEQAKGYAERYPACRRIIVTDGMRFGVYTKQSDDSFKLFAYLNLTRLRAGYPVYECGGAEEALLAMSPDWQPARASTT